MSETSDGAGNYQLSGQEVAQRLSFMLWGSIPDDALNTAADSNQLSTPAQILQQAQRMLMSDKARLKIADFHRYYILMGPNTRWDNINKDPSLFPTFTSAIVPTLMAETEKFFDSVAMVKKGTFQDLFLSPTAFVTASTAPLYGLGASGFTTDFKETTLDASRPGFLTRIGFLNAYAFFNRTSPIHRGAFIMKQVLGTPIGTPPPGAEATALPPASADLNTNRKQVDAQTTGGVCESCHHGYINPAGFAMESFDAMGVAQTKEKSSGAPIDTASDVVIDGTQVHITGRGRPDEQAGRLADGAAPLRRAAHLVPVRARRRRDGLRHGQRPGRQDRARGLHPPEPDLGPHPDSSVPHPSRRSDAMNRRVFLKGIGGVSLAAPFLPSVAEKAAKAQGMTTTPPKRLVIYFTHNGCLTNRWWQKVTTYTNGAATLTGRHAEGPDAEPLSPYIAKLTFPRGFRSQ
jgi:hypothetical protein